jgi:hypothetical protein
MIVVLDLLTVEELGRNEYLLNNDGFAFRLVDFDCLKDIMNKIEGKTI